MSHAYEQRDANLLGALGLAVADRLAELAERGAAASTAEALITLHERGSGSTIEALARVVGLTHSGTVRLVDRLADAGLVDRRRGADQRAAALQLTPAGRRAARQALARRQASMNALLAVLTDDQRAALTAAAERMLGDLGTRNEAERRLCRLCDLDACGRLRGTCPVAATVTERPA